MGRLQGRRHAFAPLTVTLVPWISVRLHALYQPSSLPYLRRDACQAAAFRCVPSNDPLRQPTVRRAGGGCGRGSPNRRPADRQCVWSKIVYSRQECRLLGKSRLGESQIVAWVGATCARWAYPVSCLGRFHLSAQRRSVRPQRGASPNRVRVAAEVPEVCHP